MAEFDPEISSLLGTFVHAPEPTGWEEKDRHTPLMTDKTDLQTDRESTARGNLINNMHTQFRACLATAVGVCYVIAGEKPARELDCA